MTRMKRVQMYIEPELDRLLAGEARRRKVSKAALLREAIREKYAAVREPDPIDALVGDCPDAEPIDDIDEFLYGPLESP